MKITMEINQRVIPNPEPEIDCGKADNGGYIVQPAIAGPVSINKEPSIINEEAKKNQNESMFRNPEAMSRAPSCSGINMFEKVPDNPPVKRKKTIIVP